MNVYAQKFIDTFNDAAKHSSRAKLFDDFLKISAAVLCRDEEIFAAVDDKDLHCQLFATLANALEWNISQRILRDKGLGLDLRIPTKPQYRDELGEIFHALDLFDQGGGQVFTPQHAANLMGETTLTAELVAKSLKDFGYVLIRENCCGSGALILGSLNALLELGINPNYFALVDASDLDERCILMTFIQLSLYQIPAKVTRRNAIDDTTYGEPLITPILKRRLNHG